MPESSSYRVLRRPALKEKFGGKLADSSLDDLIDKAGFPAPIRLGRNSIGWLEHEVDAWIRARIAERDQAKGGVPGK